MNCPTCGIKGSVKDTRPTTDGTMRRYACARLHKWKTIEQLELVYDASYVKAQQRETGQRLAAQQTTMREARESAL